ncbi:MAG: hypothetical protein IT516_15160 [Burkholderiales bacterium]|nr:hypothetical protein [Burkholderiales bacterium]
MNKLERFNAAVNGGNVDHPPLLAWVHFLSDHLDSARVIDLHLEYMRAYDWDIMKAMNDYRYPVPAGVTSLDSIESLRRYTVLSMDEHCFKTQLEVLRGLRKALGNDVPLIDTIFEPYQQILRNVGFDQADRFLSYGSATHPALEAVTETMCNYIRAARAAGIDGIFMTINGAIPRGMPRGVTREQHEQLQKPYAIELLKAAEGMTRILHIHGDYLQMDRIADYPYEVLSVPTSGKGNPGLGELRGLTGKCIMGGLDETKIHERCLSELAREIDAAIADAGREKLILSPGCTIPSFTPKRVLEYVRAYTKKI